MSKGFGHRKSGLLLLWSARPAFALSAILFFSTPSLVQPAELDRAGRKYHLEEILPAQVQEILTDEFRKRDSHWLVGICLFTRAGQRRSEEAVEDLIDLFGKNPVGNSIPVWECSTGEPENPPDPPRDLPFGWTRIADGDQALYGLFGISVMPTIFLISSEWKIVGYFPGFSPGTMLKLRKLLGTFYPSLSPPLLVERAVSNRQMKIRRREAFARQLYQKEMYPMALAQIEELDSLSLKGRYLSGMIHLQLQQREEAMAIFRAVLADSSDFHPGSLGLGIVHFRAGNLDSSLFYLDRAKVALGGHQLHYWKGRIFEEKGEQERALREYRAAFKRLLTQTGEKKK